MDNSTVVSLAELILSSEYMVAFTGAGISTSSGLPDYRGPNGIWTLRARGIEPQRPSKSWYEYHPNQGHYALVELMNMGLLKFVISQNVDGLHLKSGLSASNIAELHGNSTIMICVHCENEYHLDELGWDRNIHGRGARKDDPKDDQPACLKCGGRVVSSVVDFGDPLPTNDLKRSRTESIRSDLFLVLGSSLSVYPAASMPRIAKNNGATLVIINQGETELDHLADLKIDGELTDILSAVMEVISERIT